MIMLKKKKKRDNIETCVLVRLTDNNQSYVKRDFLHFHQIFFMMNSYFALDFVIDHHEADKQSNF